VTCRNMGKKVVSFSLWGADPKYTIGALRNIVCCDELLPDFECWFYVHEPSVPLEIIDMLKRAPKTRVILRSESISKARMWRFEAIDDPDVEIMLSRDTDSRITAREKNAIDAWLASGKTFHIMRDHPYHSDRVMAGMFGTRKTSFTWKDRIDMFNNGNNTYNYDQIFLYNNVYPYIVNDSVIHASFHRHEAHATDFPDARDDEYHFVGEYVYHDESRNQTNIDQVKRGYI